MIPDAQRHRLTAEYESGILAERDSVAGQPGAIGALLRREGFYSSHLAKLIVGIFDVTAPSIPSEFTRLRRQGAGGVAGIGQHAARWYEK